MKKTIKTGIKWIALVAMFALFFSVQKLEIRAENASTEEKQEAMAASEHVHNMQWITVKEADCLTEGEKKYACTECEYISHTTTIPKTEHSFYTILVKPICTMQGESIHVCSYCGFRYTDNIVPALGHKSTATEVPATCISPGYTHYQCSVCGSTYNDNYTDMLPHSLKKEIIKATPEQDGSITVKCTYCGYEDSTEQILAPSVDLSKATYTYSGKVKRPSIIFEGENGGKTSTKNYDVKYLSDGKSIGKHSILITLKGNYSGSLRKTYIIQPKGTELFGIKSLSRGFWIKWRTRKQVTGYEIFYTTKSARKGGHLRRVSKRNTDSLTVKKLKPNKAYNIWMRTYKKVKGKKYYSNWEHLINVTTRE